MTLRLGRAQLRPLAWSRGDAVVETGRHFHDDEGSTLADKREKRAVQAQCALAPDADLDGYALLTQKVEAAARDCRVGIFCRGNHSRDSRGRDPLRAGPCASGVRAWLERAIQRRAVRATARLVKRADFSVRAARLLVKPLTHNRPVFADDDCADHRIRTGRPPAALCEVERAFHVFEISHHFCSNNASTYSSTENGTRSSIDSPIPT